MSFKKETSPFYFYPVPIDQIDENGKTVKGQFLAKFPRLKASEISAILSPKKAANDDGKSSEEFKKEVADLVRAELTALDDLPEVALAAVADSIAQKILDRYGSELVLVDRVKDEDVIARVFQGGRETEGFGDLETPEARKELIDTTRNARSLIIRAWLKSIGVEGAAKN